MRNYTGYGWEGKNYSENLSTKDIAKIIRQRLKKEFPECKFSVRCRYFSGGSEITISLMESDFEVFNRDYRQNRNGRFYTEDDYKYAQLNHYVFLRHGFDDVDGYNNGMYLTRKAWNVLKRVVEMANGYRYDDSDAQIDYFDTNFYLDLEIGKWDKPFKVLKDKRGLE